MEVTSRREQLLKRLNKFVDINSINHGILPDEDLEIRVDLLEYTLENELKSLFN